MTFNQYTTEQKENPAHVPSTAATAETPSEGAHEPFTLIYSLGSAHPQTVTSLDC